MSLRQKLNQNPHLFYLSSGAVLIIVIVGLVFALMLSSRSQDVRQQASTGTGVAEVKLTPATLSLKPGDTGQVAISFNPKGKNISGIAVRVKYVFANTVPTLEIDNLVATITNTNSSWNCPVHQVKQQDSVISVDVGCIYQAMNGFSSNSDQTLASFRVKAKADAQPGSYSLVFDPESTVITLKETGEDVAAVPKSTAVITINDSDGNSGNNNSNNSNSSNGGGNNSNGDNQINNPTPTIAPTSSPTPTETTNQSQVTTSNQPPTFACNHSCQANADCDLGLACLNGYCRKPECPQDTTCQCDPDNVAQTHGTTDLPSAGAVSYTVISLILGSLFALGGLSLLIHHLNYDKSSNQNHY